MPGKPPYPARCAPARHLLQARPWRSSTGRILHRAMDRQADEAAARDRDHGRLPAPHEMENLRMSYDRERKPRILFTELEQFVSQRTGRGWWSGWLGKTRLIGLEEREPNQRGRRAIKLYIEEAEPRPAVHVAAASTPSAAPRWR